MVANSVEELKGERLDNVIDELTGLYSSPSQLRKHPGKALALPLVKSFRSDYASLVGQAQGLVHQIKMAILEDFLKVSSGRWENQQEVSMMCNEHGVPKVVATASLPEGADALTHEFSYKDFTHSYHMEKIVLGRVLCNEHPNGQTNIVVSGSVSRVFPNPKKNAQDIVESIVTELADLYHSGNGVRNGKFAQLRTDIRTALEIIFQVGEHGGLFGTLYEGLQQIRYRAVTSPFIAVTANFKKLPPSVGRIIMYKESASTNSPNQLAWHLRNNQFFKDLEELAAKHIPSSLVVMKDRVKGNESMSEKLVVAKHWEAVLKGYESGTLQEHFMRLGLPKPRKPSNMPPHLDDAVSLEVLIHDDAITYDLFDLTSKTFELKPEEKARLNKKMHDIFGQLAELDETGYKRHDLPIDRNGMPVKKRMPPNRRMPHFATEKTKVTRRGLVFWLDPASGRFDDYALWAKHSGYMAIHATVGSETEGLENGLVEVQIKPNVISNRERLDGEHSEYKQERAGILHFLRTTGVVSEMEWGTVRLLFTPEDRPYRDTKVSLMKL